MLLPPCPRRLRATQLVSSSLALCVGALGFPTGPAHAQAASRTAQEAPGTAYERAFNAYLEADFAGARRFLVTAQQDPETSIQELAQAYALLGLLVDIEGGVRAQVETKVDYAVSVDLNVPVPAGASRAFRELFEQVRAARRADAPTLDITEEGESAQEVVARVSNVPEGLITDLELVCEGAGSRSARGRLEATLPLQSDTPSCSAEARNAEGHVLFRATHEFGGHALPPPISQPNDDTLWIVLGVVGGVILIGGAVTIGIVASTPRDSMLGTPTVTGWSR